MPGLPVIKALDLLLNFIPVNIMKRSHRRRLFNVFAFALLAFAIYLTVFYKEDDSLQSSPSATNTTITASQQAVTQ